MSATPDTTALPTEILVSFFFLAVRTDALEQSYPGGLAAFTKAHDGAQAADGIVAWCSMGGDVEALLEDLQRHGLGPDDFLAESWDGTLLYPTISQEQLQTTIDFPPWLHARVDRGELWVSLAGRGPQL